MTIKQLEKKIDSIYTELLIELGQEKMQLVNELVGLEIELESYCNR